MSKRLVDTAIEDMDIAEKAGLVTVEYILAKFVDCVEGIGVFEGIKPQQVIRALERLGDFKKMFIQQRKVEIDFKGLLRGVSETHLESLVGVEEKIIDAELVGERNSENPRLNPGSGSKSRVQPLSTRSGRLNS